MCLITTTFFLGEKDTNEFNLNLILTIVFNCNCTVCLLISCM